MSWFSGKKSGLQGRIEALRPRLYRLAYSWTHSPALADDLTQEALTRVWKNLDQLHDADGFDKWCFKILINCWRNHLRSERQYMDVDDYVLQERETPQSLHEQQRLTEQVKRAVATLPQGQRQVVTLVDLEELSYSEVAEVLDIPIGTVMSRLCRARKLLVERILEKPSVPFEENAVLRRIK
ncbi:RNA polymerase sigma factor [Thiohalophilus sp.]|uniref:RNA polymerase sigma factor n=1 Tax=Thiohalophilus sp. TaxID=3028392 RepID=UPI002ACD6932|nr:sigma-70 family RNA polymerase sigma factor [Thiohalophilus sp.]MDZ7661234.1 sigma-70 family RNA polymerase sigma factor [Thiohalophilus sp.]